LLFLALSVDRLVCVVEDDADARACAKLLLETGDCRVADFASAEAFLHAMAAMPPVVSLIFKWEA